MSKSTDPNSPVYQAIILQDGFAPQDEANAVLASEMAGPTIDLAPDEVQQAQMADPPTYSTTDVPLTPPPGSIATHVDIGTDESMHSMLADRQYSMLKESE